MPRKIKLWIDTGFVGGDHEDYEDLPDGWDAMSEADQEKLLNELAKDFLGNRVEYGASVVDE